MRVFNHNTCSQDARQQQPHLLIWQRGVFAGLYECLGLGHNEFHLARHAPGATFRDARECESLRRHWSTNGVYLPNSCLMIQDSCAEKARVQEKVGPGGGLACLAWWRHVGAWPYTWGLHGTSHACHSEHMHVQHCCNNDATGCFTSRVTTLRLPGLPARGAPAGFTDCCAPETLSRVRS